MAKAQEEARARVLDKLLELATAVRNTADKDPVIAAKGRATLADNTDGYWHALKVGSRDDVALLSEGPEEGQ